MKKQYAMHLLSLLIFGTNGIVASNISLSSTNIVLFRTLIGTIFLLALFLLTKQKFSLVKQKQDLLFVTLSGISMGASWLLLFEAYDRTGVGISTLLGCCGPVIVMILSPLLFKERFTAAKVIGFAIVLCGILCVNGGAEKSLNTSGVICAFCSALCYAGMVIANKKAKYMAGLEKSLLQLVIGLVTVVVFTGIKSGFAIKIASEDWPWILLIGIINTGLGCFLFFTSIGSLPVQTVAICSYLEPLSAVIFAMLILHETMTAVQIIGAILIIGGAVLGECVKKKNNAIKCNDTQNIQ